MIKSREDYLYYLEEDRKAEKGARGGVIVLLNYSEMTYGNILV